MAERLAREGQADAEGAGGGFHHGGAEPEFAALLGAEQHGDGGARLHAARAEPFELGPEAGVRAGQIGGDAGERGAAEQTEELPVAGGVHDGGGHRAAPRISPW